jgi:cell division cycle 2-like protein
MASRWADSEADAAETLRRKKEKEEKKRLKLLKQKEEEAAAAAATQEADSRPTKRRRVSSTSDTDNNAPQETPENSRELLRFNAGSWSSARHTSNYETLNPIEEGSYGYVSRARNISTSQIVALKKIKTDTASHDGFPITALREISILQKARHTNIVELLEVLSSEQDVCVLVMEFVEHDLKTLMEDMSEPFLASETKTLLSQLVSAVGYLHSNHIIHRDIKTSNILLSHRGTLKLADFGMARYVPPRNAPLTQLVVTLWYRAPELLLGAERYGTEVDLWSIGCVMGELIIKEPVLQGGNEVDQLAKIFTLCGLPTERSWPGFRRLPNAKSLKLPRDTPNAPGFDRARFPFLTGAGIELLSSLLSLNPDKRPTAEDVLAHSYFKEQPRPKPKEMFPTFPSKAGQEKRRRRSPDAPKRGEALAVQSIDFSGLFASRETEEKGGGFMLKMA